MTGTLAESDLALDAIQRYADADNPSAFLAVNEGNSYFRLPGRPGLIVYRPTGRYLVQFGGAFAPEAERTAISRAFVEYAEAQAREIVAVQVQAADTPTFLGLGFMVNQMGASYAVDLATFTLHGTRFMQLRNKISRALRLGLEVREVPFEDWDEAVRELDAAWLTTKGPDARPLDYLVGQTGGRHQSLRRLFVGLLDQRLAGYISYSPVYGSRQGWMHDLSRRMPDVPPGVMEAINRSAIDAFLDEGVGWLHFGFTPFTSLDAPRYPGYSRAFHWLVTYLWEHGEHIYPARSQLAYKQKWGPEVVLPEYLAFQHRASIPALVHVFRACNAI